MCVCFFSGVKNVSADSVSDTANRSGKVSVLAVVLPTQEFLSLLGRNSRVSLEKEAFTPGQSVHIEAKVTTGGKERFSGHTLTLSVRNAHVEEVVVLSQSTDDFGKTVFEFTIDKRFLGENTVQIVDTYYDVPVILDQSAHFIVYEEEQDDTQHEKERKTMIVSPNVSLSAVSVAADFGQNAENFENNGTIVKQESLLLPRIGPGDP